MLGYDRRVMNIMNSESTLNSALGSRSKPLWDTISNSSLRLPESTRCGWPKWLTFLNQQMGKQMASMGYHGIHLDEQNDDVYRPSTDDLSADLCPLTPSAVGSFPILRYTNGAFAKIIQQQELHCDALNTRDLKSRNITPSFNPAKETIFNLS